MTKNYVDEFYLIPEADAMEKALKELSIGYTRKDDVISPETAMHCTIIEYSIEGKDIIDITYGTYKALVNLYIKYQGGRQYY